MVAILCLWSVKHLSYEVRRDRTCQKKRSWVPVAWVITMLCSFAVRLVYPVGKIWTPLSLQLAYLPQYVLAYFGGHCSAIWDDIFILIPSQYDNRNTLRQLLRALTLMLLSLGLLTGIERMRGIDVEQLGQLTRGGFNFPAMYYAVWNEAGFAFIGFALVAAFLQHGDVRWTYGNVWLPRYAYGAFLLHPLVSLAVELPLESFMGCRVGNHRSNSGLHAILGPALGTLVVGMVNIIATWTVAWLLLSAFPMVSRVI